MYDLDSLTNILNNLIDLSSDMMAESTFVDRDSNETDESVDDIAFILSALVDDMLVRSAYDELDWVLTSLRDTNLESTSCLVLSALLLTRDYTSIKRDVLSAWYLQWISQNRSEMAAFYLAQLLAPEGPKNEHHAASTSGQSASPNKNT